jgi:hypothetical protein
MHVGRRAGLLAAQRYGDFLTVASRRYTCRAMNLLTRRLPAIAMIALAMACGGPPELRPVYQEENLHVGLLKVPGERYSHPQVMSSTDIARVLGGLWCRNRNAVISFGNESEEGRFPTFTDVQIERLAAYLAGALEQAAVTEVVTYYVTAPHAAGRRVITSGAVYVTDGRLGVIVSNCRSEPHDARDFGFSVDIDTPDYPLVPVNLAEQFRVGYTPAEAVVADATLSEALVRRMRGYRRPTDGKKFVTIALNRLSMHWIPL